METHELRRSLRALQEQQESGGKQKHLLVGKTLKSRGVCHVLFSYVFNLMFDGQGELRQALNNQHL